MKRTAFAGLLGMALGLAAGAQEYPELAAGMKVANAASNVLTKLESKTGPEAVSSAERLAAVNENMIAFWRQRSAANAVKWSEEGKAAAVQLANAANSGDAEKAAAAFQAVSATCQSCHTAYREKSPDGTYRIRSNP